MFLGCIDFMREGEIKAHCSRLHVCSEFLHENRELKRRLKYFFRVENENDNDVEERDEDDNNTTTKPFTISTLKKKCT